MADVELRAARRTVAGKKVRFLRRQGLVPANMYGPGLSSTPLQLPAREVDTLLRRTTTTMLVPLRVDDEAPRRVLVRGVQRHPVDDHALHVDFYALAMNETLRTAVGLHFTGEAPAVAQFNGTLVHNVDTIDVECLPADLPARIDVDLSGLEELHQAVHVRDLPVPPGVTILTPDDTAVVTVLPPAIEVEEVEEAAAAEAAPEAPAAEAAPAEAAEEPAAEEAE
jgi:large subunit ribosomal protein L25